MQERLAAEHARELLRHALEHLLDRRRVADEVDSHLEAFGRDVAHRRLDVVRDPLHEVRAVLVLHVEHLLVHLLGRHATTEHGGGSQVATVARVRGAHHVLGIEHLLRQLRHSERAVLLRSARRQRREPDHEEMKTRERHDVHGQLAEIGVELTREAERARHARHHRRHQMVQVTESRRRQLERTEADVVQRLVVNAEALVRVLHELMHRQRRVVRLHNCVRHLRRRHNREGEHDTIRVLLADLRDEERSHAGAGATAKRVRDLEALEAIARLRLLAHNVKNRVDQLSALSVMALGPVVAGARLSKDKVVRAEDLTIRASAHRVHGTRLKIHENRAGNIASAGRLVVVDVDALELKIGISMVGTGRVDTVLVGDNLPELGSDLVAALASLDVDDLAHCRRK
mmetsp:Transcript_58489/g.137358  ORF Transcript_58489/g.137358 Transcript_58489/m.137358 type:complete len:401 (+) Transcript_58489:252-1454(+)